MASKVGVEIVQQLLENIQDSHVEYAYIDEDDDGKYLGIVFSDGGTEYHLTFQQDGYVQLAAGPEEGNTLEEVMSFSLGEVEEPFSTDGDGEE